MSAADCEEKNTKSYMTSISNMKIIINLMQKCNLLSFFFCGVGK